MCEEKQVLIKGNHTAFVKQIHLNWQCRLLIRVWIWTIQFERVDFWDLNSIKVNYFSDFSAVVKNIQPCITFKSLWSWFASTFHLSFFTCRSPKIKATLHDFNTGSELSTNYMFSLLGWRVQCSVPSPGRGSSLRAAVSTVEGGCAMCSVGGVWGELVCTGMSSDWRLPSTWFWVGVFWRSKVEEAITKCKHKSQHLSWRCYGL